MPRFAVRKMTGMAPGESDQAIPTTNSKLAENIDLDNEGAIESREGTSRYLESAKDPRGIARVYLSSDLRDMIYLSSNGIIASDGLATEDTATGYTRTFSPLSSQIPNTHNTFYPGEASFTLGAPTVTFSFTSTQGTSIHSPIDYYGWGNVLDPDHALASDDAVTTMTLPTFQSQYFTYQYKFNDEVPSDAVLNGFEVFVEGRYTGTTADISRLEVALHESDGADGIGRLSATAKTVTTSFSTTEAVVTLGSSTDLWGLTTATFTASLLRDKFFGINFNYLSTDASSATSFEIDAVSARAYFTSASNPKLTKNITEFDLFRSDEETFPGLGQTGFTIASDSAIELSSSSGTTGSSTDTYFERNMRNSYFSTIEQIPSLDRVVIANNADIPWEYSLIRDSVYPVGNPAPVASLTLSTAGGSGLQPGTYKYIHTFESDYGEGNAASSATITLAATEDVSVTGIDRGNNKVINRKLYRTTGSAGTYFLLDTVTGNTSTSYTDSTPDTDLILGDGYDTFDRSQPPALRMFRWHHNRGWGFVRGENIVRYARIGSYDDWDAARGLIRTSNGDTVRNIMPLGDVMVVYTNSTVEIITGRSELSFGLRQVESQIGLYGQNTVTNIEQNQQVFLARDGLRFFNGASSRLVIGEDYDILFDDEEPKQGETDYRMNRAEIDKAFGIYRENTYYLFYPSTGNTFANRVLIYDFELQSLHLIKNIASSPDIADTDTVVGATTWDAFNDRNGLFLAGSSTLWKMFEGRTIEDAGGVGSFDIEMHYRTKHMDLREHNLPAMADKIFRAVHVIAESDDGSLKVEVFVDRTKAKDFTHNFSSTGVAERLSFPLPNDIQGQEIQLRFTYQGQVKITIEGFDIDYELFEKPLDGSQV